MVFLSYFPYRSRIHFTLPFGPAAAFASLIVIWNRGSFRICSRLLSSARFTCSCDALVMSPIVFTARMVARCSVATSSVTEPLA